MNANDSKYRAARLGVGVVSLATLDAAIALSGSLDEPILLIGSRGQVGNHTHGGYVESWTSQDFAAYVRGADSGQSVAVCRDHGGPWQGPNEHNLMEDQAMDAAIRGLLADIEAGFDVVHIDATLEANGVAQWARTLERTLRIRMACEEFASSRNIEVAYEIGMEEHGSGFLSATVFEERLAELTVEFKRNGCSLPRYVSPSLGTLVFETRNTGDVESDEIRDQVLDEVRLMSKVCEREGVLLKAHNMDYVSTAAIRDLFDAGVTIANVAPEFGVVESRFLLASMLEADRQDLHKAFVAAAVGSGKWKKWIGGADVSDIDKSQIAGHYIFSTEDGRRLRNELSLSYVGPNDLETDLRNELQSAMRKYLLPDD